MEVPSTPFRIPGKRRKGMPTLAALLASLLTFRGNARCECVVYGKAVSLEGMLVSTQQDRFHFDTYQVPMSAELPLSERSWFKFAITDVLSFKAMRKGVSLYVQRPIATPALQVAAGVEIVGAHAAGNEIIGSIVLEYIGSSDCGPDAPGVLLTPVRLPCDALSLPDATTNTDDLRSDPPEQAGEPPPAWTLRSERKQVHLRSLPNWNAPAFTVKTANKGAALSMIFQELARQGDWIHLRGWGKGTHFTGWMRRSELESIPALDAYSQGGIGGCTLPESGHSAGESTGDARPTYRGKAKVAAGAPVYGKGPWAIITKSIEHNVRYELGSKRVQLLYLPGFSGDELDASVPVEFVESPKPLPIGP
jgi:hypothetical protein